MLAGLTWLASVPSTYVDAGANSHQAAWRWTLVAAAVPVFGFVVYWLAGRNDVERESTPDADELPSQFTHGSEVQSSVSPESEEHHYERDVNSGAGGG